MRDTAIQVFEGVFNEEFCEMVMKLFESETKVDTMKITDNGKTIKSSIDLNIPFGNHPELDSYTHKEKWVEIFQHFADAVGECMQLYNERIQGEQLDKLCPSTNQYILNNLYLPRKITTPVIQKYSSGDYHSWHTDYRPGHEKLLSLIFYLNDVDEDAGGTTEFANNVHVRPKMGKVVVYPADHRTLHQFNPLTHGEKYIVRMFTVHDYINDNEKQLELERDELRLERDELRSERDELRSELDELQERLNEKKV